MHEVVSGEVQGLMLGFSGNEVRVKAHHEFGSGGIIDTPESHENGLDTGFLERGLESDDAVLRCGSGGCVAVSVSMVLSRDCRRDQGYPKTVAPMLSVSLVRAKTFFAHVTFILAATCMENVLMRTESYIAWKEMTISKDHVAEKPWRGWDLWRHGRP